MSEGKADQLGARMRAAVKGWLAGDGLPRPVHLVIGLFAPMAVLLNQMWAMRHFTVDDAYITFRYARNWAEGHGLVYNLGQTVEGYTNFSLTILVGIGIKLGLDPHLTAKVIGGASSLVLLWAVYRFTDFLQPLKTLPCVSTWLLATSAPLISWSVFGMETSLFAALVVAATWRMMVENDREHGYWVSGLLFAAAGLTRPEAPLFIGVPMLLLGRRFLSRQNILRGVVFVVPLLVHLLWRKSFYGEWLPSTLGAKTGDLGLQLKRGKGYFWGWLRQAGPVVYLGFYGLALGVVRKSRAVIGLALVAILMGIYVVLVGGDWMSYYRFLVPAEPFVYVLAGYAARSIAETRDRAGLLALALFGAYVGWQRQDELRDARKRFRNERKHWHISAGRAADWIADNLPPGSIALGDIGYVGWRTNYPIFDLLGLVEPVIHKLPGGYTKKIGPGYVERFYEVMPDYPVLIMSDDECDRPALKGVRVITEDPRFEASYRPKHAVVMSSDASWCIFVRR